MTHDSHIFIGHILYTRGMSYALHMRGNHRNDRESVLFSLQNKINFRDFNSSEYKSSKKGKSLKAFLG